jgi:hypothetical protein
VGDGLHWVYMISKGRILSIFRTKGGSGGFTSTLDELPQSAKELLETELQGDRPLIARVKSEDNWFALTSSQLISSVEGRVRQTRLDDIVAVSPERRAMQLLEVKRSGGPFDLKLADDSVLTVWLDGGKPFVGLLNVFNYIVKMNRGRRSGQGLFRGRVKS